MVSSSTSSSRNWRYDVFTSFHGPDVRSKFLSHLRKQFDDNSIIMFDDTGIERSQIIGSALTNAIKESRIAIVLLSKNYASSSWCLDELLEIMKCKEDIGKIVMTIFYEVDPSHVRKQNGDFGKAFNKTCDGTTDEKKREWSQALTYVSKIAGEDFKNCDNEAKRIEKIASDVSNKLIASSRSFDDMVGLEDHLKKVESLLDLAYDGAKIVGISGPAGIGKSTIARALHSRLYNRFDHTCFMDNLRENYKNGPVDYRLKLRLQEKLLSNMLNLNGIRICHLRLIMDTLPDKKVLIILDDVDDVDQLETLANIEWFGPGSRVIVTTTNKEILQQHGISDIYHVGFPSEREALMIFCISAFGERSPPAEFMNLAYEVVRICGNLPLALRVLGSSLWGKSHAEWIDELPRLRNRLDGNIESVLIVGFESLDKKVQSLFLCIAIFFNYEHADHVTSMLAKTTLDVRRGLKILANKYLIHIDHDDESRVVMHRLLQVMAREVISKQAFWKRQVLVDAHKIRDVLEDADTLSGTGSIVGVSFNVAEIKQLIIRASAFKRMCNLVFLKVYGWRPTPERQLHIPEEMEFPPGLRLLDWDAYPRKSLPLRFCTKNLVELRMVRSKLEKLWEGTKALAKLKIMNLLRSSRLKELPDLSNATNLERLDLSFCTALVELPASIRHCSRLEYVDISSSRNLKSLTHLPKSVTHLKLSNSGIERITDCIKGLHNLQVLNLSACKRLVSLPELPGSLKRLVTNDCDALERVNSPLNTPDAELDFTNCFKLGRQARRAVIQQSFVHGWAFLPGREVPAEFHHRVRRSSLTFHHTAFNKFKVCVVISPNHHQATELNVSELLYHCKVIGNSVKLADMKFNLSDVSRLQKAHLFIFHSDLSFIDPYEVSTEIMVQFSISCEVFNIVECGIQILEDDSDDSNSGSSGDEDEGNDYRNTHESSKVSDREEDNDSIANRRSKAESGEMSYKEDDEDQDYKSEASEEDDESVLRKRPRNL